MTEDAPQREYFLREVLNGLRWMVRTGASWRMIANNLPPWHTVYEQTQRWINPGCFEVLVHDLRELLQVAQGKKAQPTAIVLDGRTLRSTPESGARAGLDSHFRVALSFKLRKSITRRSIMTNHIESTLNMLRDQLTEAVVKKGTEMISQWEAELEKADWRGAKTIHADLIKLRHHLEGGVLAGRALDSVIIGALLIKLGGSSVQAASHAEGDTGARVANLGRALIKAGKGLRANLNQSVQGHAFERVREELRACDPVLCGIIDANPELDVDGYRQSLPVEGLFQALLFQIIGQQISVSAGNAIYARLRALFPDGRPEPEILAETSVEMLRGLGLSARKAEYARDLARRAIGGELDGLADLPHTEAREKLVSFKGIGPWTADGALLIAFGGADVLVAGDLVLRKAVQRAYGLPGLPSEKEVEALGEQWRPYRTIAAGYLFESMTLG